MPLLRSALIALSQNRSLRRFMESSWLGQRVSRRFVAGLEIENALLAAAEANQLGIAVTLDALGESVTNEAEAHEAALLYHKLLDAINARKLNANVSLKLTQMGLNLSEDLANKIVSDLVDHAARLNNFVRIDMEDASLTDQTLKLVHQLKSNPKCTNAVGVVIQAYLYRSKADIEQLLKLQTRVRLCKGAYKEPPERAFPRKAEVDANYLRLSHQLLASGVFHGLATHDEAMISAIKNYARQNGILPASFEFQMLFGVRRDLQKQLVQQGYNVRVYIPFGRDWYPYFMRRLAERPANVLFLLKNLLR